MREILFRGKRADNGEWVKGYFYEHEPPLVAIAPKDYVPEPSKWYIARTAFADWSIPRQVEFIGVDPFTVGQFTGLTDKNGKRVFEGDILQDVDTGKTFEIIYQGHMFLRYERGPMYMFYTLDGDCLEIIGNIHDNPELLEEPEPTDWTKNKACRDAVLKCFSGKEDNL